VPFTRIALKELEAMEMSTMRVRNVATDDETLEILNWLRKEYRCGQISRVAFVEQVTALGVLWLDAEYDASRIDAAEDYDRTQDT
jgi:hypothetical protein